MKTAYRGYEIEVTKEPSLMGTVMVFWNIFRASDGYLCADGFEDSEETLVSMTEYLKTRVDAELAEKNPWGEAPEMELEPKDQEICDVCEGYVSECDGCPDVE